MASSTITEKVNICEIVFDVAQFQIPDAATECNELMDKLQKILGTEMFNDLESAIGYRVYKAQQSGFQVGWQMRGQV